MSELSKIIMGTATPEQIADLLADVFSTAGVEAPAFPATWEAKKIRLLGAIRHGKQAVEFVSAWQKSNDNMRKF